MKNTVNKLGKTLLLLLPSFILLVIAPASYAVTTNKITATLTVTNVPVTGYRFEYNSSIRLWTNASTSSTILTNLAGVNQATTNFYNQILAWPISGLTVLQVATNQLKFYGRCDADWTFLATNWASVTYSTNSCEGAWALRLPIEVEEDEVRTNFSSKVVSLLSNYPTNAIAPSATALSNYLSLSTTQVVTGPKLFNGANVYSNALQLYHGGSISNVTATITNGLVANTTLSNCIPTRLVGGYWTNGIADGLTVTNLNSPGTAASTLRLGAGAIASAVGAQALGGGSTAAGTSATVTGNGSDGEAPGSSIHGANSVVGIFGTTEGTGGAAFARNTTVLADGGLALGDGTTVARYHTNSVAIGGRTTTTKTNQIRLGTNGTIVTISGVLEAASSTNNYLTGTNTIAGDMALPATVVTTLANGVNAVTPTGVRIRFTGTLTADSSIDEISGAREGRWLRLENATGYALTLKHQSGSAGTVANRLYVKDTLTNVVMITGGHALLHYDSTLSRWVVEDVYPDYRTRTNRVYTPDGAEWLELTHDGTSGAVTTKASSAGNVEPLLLQTGAGAGSGQITLNTNGTTKVSGATLFGATATTSGAVTTNAYTFTPSISSAYSVWIQVTGLERGLAEAGAYVVESAFRVDAGGVVTEVGADAAIATQEDDATWAVVMDTSGGTIRVRVTGGAGDTVDWRVTGRIVQAP